MAQRKFDNGGELVIMPSSEFVTLRAKLEGIVAIERSRYAAIARWFLQSCWQTSANAGEGVASERRLLPTMNNCSLSIYAIGMMILLRCRRKLSRASAFPST